MNVAIAKERRNDILKVDSINSSNADFMITHVPFRKICVRENLQSNISEHLSEEEIYSKFFANSDVYNRHQFIIVEGSSGSGKSHFIRWLNAKLQPVVDAGTDVVLLIRRSDNTLKGTIKQLLNIDAVRNIKNKEAYERLLKANQTISELRFKETIYSKFIVEINTCEKDDVLSRVQKKQLVALLNNDKFKERMMAFGGPIDRIYQKVAGTDAGVVYSIDALFEESDFTLTIDFNEGLQDADRNAKRMADRLIPDYDNESLAGKVVTFMNSFVDGVVQSCAGIETGDFQAIFREIRQELYSQNKNLILLIEDITAFTGINQDLLNALVTEHTGENGVDKLCRLVSVVGTTTQYYSEFRDNYRDRITSQITIEDGAIGDNIRDAVVFCARYLNALSLKEGDVKAWYSDGALESEYPVHKPDCEWDTIRTNNTSINIFPFTTRAIELLYQNMSEHKTPRYIIREIIEPAVNDIIANKGVFPIFLSKWRRGLKESVEAKILDSLQRLNGIENRDTYKNCVLAFVYYWGNGTLDVDEKKGTIAGIRKSMFVKFGLEKFANAFLMGDYGQQASIEESYMDADEVQPATYNAVAEVAVEEPVNKRYEDLKTAINSWLYENKVLSKTQQIREPLCAFVFESLNWQQLGVSMAVRELVKNSSVNLFSIERQDRANARGLIELKATEETKDVLLAIGKYLYWGEKSWNFYGAAEAVFTLTCWLENHKQEIINAVLEGENGTPSYIKCALLADIIYLCLNDNGIRKYSDITADKILAQYVGFNADLSCHSKEWASLVAICNNDNSARDNHKQVLDYFNLVQGTGNTKYYINFTALENAIKLLAKNNFLLNFEEINNGIISGKKKAIDYCKKICDRLTNVNEMEATYVSERIDTLLNFFGYDEDVDIEDSDIRDMLGDIKSFYEKVDSYGLTFVKNRSYQADELKRRNSEIAKTLVSVRGEDGQYALGNLLKYVGSKMKLVNELVELLKNADSDADVVERQVLSDKDKLVRAGGWVDNIDPRFDTTAEEFEKIKGVI